MAIRVYQIAKEYSRSSEEVIGILRDAGIEVSSQTSPLDEHALHTIRAKLGTFKLTVVDGETESPVAKTNQAEPKPVPKKSSKRKSAAKAEPPQPRLKVRVIKKHDEEPEPEAPEEEKAEVPTDVSDVSDTKQEKPKLQKPLLKLSKKRQRSIHERIAKVAQTTPTAPTASGAEPEAPKPPVTPPVMKGQPTASNETNTVFKPAKRQERPFTPQGDRPQRPQGDRPPRPQGDRPPRQQGDFRPPPRTQGDRPPRPQGDFRPPPRTSGDFRNQPRRPAGPPRNAPPGRNQRATAPISSFMDSSVTGPPKGTGRNHKGNAPGKAFPKKSKKRRKNQEHIEKIRPVTVSKVILPEEELGIIMLSEGVTVKELAEKVNRKAKDIIKRLFEKGIMATLNDILEDDLAIEIAKDFGYEAEIVSFEEDLQLREDDMIVNDDQDDGERERRAPIVTIMGHVDHGKTTLLDAIRSTKVASGEAGGITQHIGAYAVDFNNQNIVFLDTPGHEAFTKMRARGASVTDIVILVVAADDGVKPQTIEAINHAKAARVPIIVCINKMDKPDANPDKVKQMLTEHELVIEEFGGDSPCVQVSAKMGKGIDELLEMILLVSELQDITANHSRRGQGTVIEAKLDRGRGPVATVIVQEGTVNVGDYFIMGSTHGKIRAMHGDFGQKIETAPPSTPVEILGIQEVPHAGDIFMVVQDEPTARQISSFRKDKAREDQFRHQKHTTLDQLFSSMGKDEVQELRLILKADVQGSVEGLAFALNKLESEKVQLRFVHQGVGNVTENDVLLAVAADAIVIAFNVKTEPKAADLADSEKIEIRNYSIIYEVVNQVESAMLGLLAPELKEREIGKAYVKQVFSVNKLGKVAGCHVDSGIVRRDAHVRVFREGQELFDGRIQTLKRFRDDVNEVKTGYECGIGIKGFSDLQEQDQLVFYAMDEIRPTSL